MRRESSHKSNTPRFSHSLSLSLSLSSVSVGARSCLGAMNVKITGSGELTLVLSHGYGGSQYIWDAVLPELSQRYRVVVFDWSFSGSVDLPIAFDPFKFSSFHAFSDDLISLVEEMDLKGAVFVGHSMAGMIGCIASVKRPDLFSRLVLIGASPRYLNVEDYVGGFEMEEVEHILSDIESDFKTWAQGFAPLVIGTDDSVSIEKFRTSLQRMRPEIALAVAQTIFLSNLRGAIESVEVPCTIIQGTNDVVVPVSVGRYMQSKMKGHTSLEIMETDGHIPQLTAHQLLIEVLDKILTPNT